MISVKNFFCVLFFISFLGFNLSGCLKTRLTVKEINNPQRSHLKERADLLSRWHEIQESLRKLNGRIENIEHEIKKNQDEKEKNQSKEALAFALIEEQLKTHVEALKKIENDISRIKKRIYRKKKKKKVRKKDSKKK